MRTSRPAHGNRPFARLVTSTLLALVVAALAAGPAAAATGPTSRRRSGRARSTGTTAAEADIAVDQVRDRVREAGTPIYVAILPDRRPATPTAAA